VRLGRGAGQFGSAQAGVAAATATATVTAGGGRRATRMHMRSTSGGGRTLLRGRLARTPQGLRAPPPAPARVIRETKGRLQIYGKPESRSRSRAWPTVMRRLAVEALHTQPHARGRPAPIPQISDFSQP
jgi:hypothetical protein